MLALSSLNMFLQREPCFSFRACVKGLCSSRPNWNVSFRIWFVTVCSSTGLIPEMFAVFCTVCSSITSMLTGRRDVLGGAMPQHWFAPRIRSAADSLLTTETQGEQHTTLNRRQGDSRVPVGPQACCCYYYYCIKYFDSKSSLKW